MMSLTFFSFLSLVSILCIVTAAPVANVTVTSMQASSMQHIAAINKASFFNPTALPANATENGLTGSCKPIILIFAKGTGENGNVGDGSSPGPAWFSELRNAIGEDKIAVQGVQYEADVFGYLVGGDPEGSQNYLTITNQAVTQCPDSKIVIGGYSQGAQITHNAAQLYSPLVTSRIAAVVLFGDPYTDKPVGQVSPTSVLEICHDGDIICTGSGGPDPHLTYSKDATSAAKFVLARI